MSPIVQFFYIGLTVYIFLIVLRLILEPFALRPRTFVYSLRTTSRALTEPYLKLFRRVLPDVGRGSVDWSALIGLIVIVVVLQILRRI